MKRSKKPWIVLLVVVSLYSGVEFLVFVTGHVGTFNTVRRMVAAAPAVEWQGARLAYVGTERLSNTDRVALSSAENDSEIMLYKIAYAPDNPPYVFVHQKGEKYFKYRIPRAAWSM